MKPEVYLREELKAVLAGRSPFDFFKMVEGDIYRDKEGRRTLRFIAEGKRYFVKYHQGVGWREIWKNLLQARLPIISARNEWQAIQTLHRVGVDTMTLAGYGETGLNPAQRRSFVVTDELTHTMSLEYLGEQWQHNAPSLKSKRLLIDKLADMTRRMHHAGLNHRDYYLCHVLLTETFAQTNTISEQTQLFLIDLHRAQQRKRVPARWLIKDLASLYFSAHAVSLTKRDKLRFIRAYSGLSLRFCLTHDRRFWHKVQKRRDALMAKWQRQHD
ncbi:Lipopolysaccharide core biosynthesis protein WaaP, heptosyl-I-kinase [Methylophaga frappieri]|uniref:Lipopolysaccharide core heptose(I) kinase n=2 Tax=Methylophaga frappieri (strain ATCC BAA-2434 / DSM 25690 / JAM7) TaxID=754477 RepID=I1YKE2_METFJ|nr:Lipopolysaccharide core biosynthesis protein WaaP, heptosyl-I-kinase [Methylophaga frappieri]